MDVLVELHNAFINACSSGDLRTAKEILANPTFDINNGGEYNTLSALITACIYNHPTLVRHILKDPRLDTSRVEPYYHTCLHNRIRVVKELIRDNRFDPNAYAPGYDPPLVAQCFAPSRQPIFQLLLTHPRINPNQANAKGTTSLMGLSRMGECLQRVNMMTCLLRDPRVDVNLTDTCGASAIWYACRNISMLFVKMILASRDRVDLDQPGKWNSSDRPCTAMMLAYRHKGQEMFNLLTAYRSNPGEVRRRLCQELGWCTSARDLFALIIFVCEGLLDPQSDTPSARFFRIAARLHLDLQMVLVNRCQGLAPTLVPLFDRRMGIERMAQFCLGSQTTSQRTPARKRK